MYMQPKLAHLACSFSPVHRYGLCFSVTEILPVTMLMQMALAPCPALLLRPLHGAFIASSAFEKITEMYTIQYST